MCRGKTAGINAAVVDQQVTIVMCQSCRRPAAVPPSKSFSRRLFGCGNRRTAVGVSVFMPLLLLLTTCCTPETIRRVLSRVMVEGGADWICCCWVPLWPSIAAAVSQCHGRQGRCCHHHAPPAGWLGLSRKKTSVLWVVVLAGVTRGTPPP